MIMSRWLLLPLLHTCFTPTHPSPDQDAWDVRWCFGSGMAFWVLDNADPFAFGATSEPGRQDR